MSGGEKLGACPFCQGDATIEVAHSKITGVRDKYFPSCLNGDCPAFIVDPYVTYSRKCEAITAWNTRTPDPLLVQVLEVLRPFADRIRVGQFKAARAILAQAKERGL